MIYKGCIMKIEDDFAIVLSNDMQYIKVVKKDGMNIGNQIIFVKDDIYKENKINYKRISALAAVVFVLFISINVFNIKNNKNIAAAAVVSLDINPSIEFELNKNGIVIKVNSINEEANEIIDEDVVGKKIEDALYITINNAKEKKYISVQKNSILISEAILDPSIENKLSVEKDLQIKLNNDESDNYVNIVYLKSNKKNMKNAHKNDMSIGKYEAFKEIEKQNTDISMYEVKNMKVYQIFDGSGKIYDDVIEADKQDNSIKDEIDNIATEAENDDITTENEDKIDETSSFENQTEEVDYSKDLKDNQGRNTYKKDKYKDEDEDEDDDDDDDDSKFKDKIKHSKNKKHKKNKDKDHDKFEDMLEKYKNLHSTKDDD
ncbi:anti-sigma factor domain-containing protein [Tepidibacter aestuarii]|uniref:anti-sigma factor domain-containing protein n=1 Tax=Tepidibacter aestuarii TaxID=2925782 RepID=UPI0020BE2DD0|nr:anti-sigma factor domain-containing protein [Tepidibacter aestuarii]CAH2215291.1 putative RsgI N-terminal anti-sigma domain-containing protein [Tepidibacter aestuarii]